MNTTSKIKDMNIEPDLEDILELVTVLEESEARNEVTSRYNKVDHPSIDYENEIGYRLYARQVPGLAKLLDANHEERSVDKKQFKRLRKKDKNIDRLFKLFQTNFFDYFDKQAKNFIHGDSAVWNVMSRELNGSDESSESELGMIDWENPYMGMPQQSLWTLLATAAPTLEHRLAIQDEVLVHAFKKRYGVSDHLSGDGRNKFDTFRRLYERMDLYQSILQIPRQLDRKRKKEKEGNEDFAQFFAESAIETYHHVQKKLDDLNLVELKEEFDKYIKTYFSDDDLITLGFKDGFVQKLRKHVARKDFEQEGLEAERKRDRKERIKDWFGRNYGKLTAGASAALVAVGVVLGVSVADEKVTMVSTEKYQRGHTPTVEDYGYTYEADAPYQIKDIVIKTSRDSTTLAFDRPARIESGEKFTLDLILAKEHNLKPQKIVASLYESSSLISSSYHYKDTYDVDRDGIISLEFEGPHLPLPFANLTLNLGITDGKQYTFSALYSVNVIPSKDNANSLVASCFYENTEIHETSVSPKKINKGDVVNFDINFTVTNPDAHCLVPFYQFRTKAIIELSNGTRIEKPLDVVSHTSNVPCEPNEDRCGSDGKKWKTKSIDFLFKDLPVEKIVRLEEDYTRNPAKMQVDFYVKFPQFKEVWIGTDEISSINPAEFRRYQPTLAMNSEPMHGELPEIPNIDKIRMIDTPEVNCFPETTLRINPDKRTTLELECSANTSSSSPDLKDVGFRAYIPGLNYHTAVTTIPKLSPLKNETMINAEYQPVSVSLSAKIDPRSGRVIYEGLYRMIIEYFVEGENPTYKPALETYVEVSNSPSTQITIDKFMKAAKYIPARVNCYHDSTELLGGAQGFFSCLNIVKHIDGEDGPQDNDLDAVLTELNPLMYTTQIITNSSGIQIKPNSANVIIGTCQDFTPYKQGRNVSLPGHFQVTTGEQHSTQEQAFFAPVVLTEDDDKSTEEGLIRSYQVGDNRFLFVCTSATSDKDIQIQMTDTLLNPESDLSVMTIRYDNGKIRFEKDK